MSRRVYYKTTNDLLNANSPIPNFQPPQKPAQITEVAHIPRDVDSVKNMGVNFGPPQQMTNPGDPQVWGPAFWFTLHNGAMKYPEKASPICAERMKGFIIGIPVMIPCEKCADHASAHIESNWNNMDRIVSGKMQLFNFFVDFHNYVNKRYGKPEMNYEDAYKMYSSGVNITKFSYN